MAEIFLSYRRQDSQSATGRLADRLDAHFGGERVFRDRDDIAAGLDFAESIRRAIASATVLLVVIGPRWLAAVGGAGRRRLDDPADFVRLEIELALQADVAIVPVLVEGAAMPAADELPPSIGALSRCQAVELSDLRWRYDVDRLIETLQARFALDAAADATPLASGAAQPGGLARLMFDIVDLATHPTRLIARRLTGQATDYARAFTFLFTALLVGDAMLLWVIDTKLIAQGSVAQVAVGIASWFVAGQLVLLLVAGFMGALLALAWRLATGRPAARRVSIVWSYVFAGVWLGTCGWLVAASSALAVMDPSYLERSVAALRAGAPSSAFEVAEPRAEAVGLRAAVGILLLVGAAIWLATAVWCVAAWGAFRQAFAVTRVRAWLATMLWIALLAALLWLGRRLV
jgi:hypothetical protein